MELDDIEDIIEKKLSNRATAREIELFNTWIEESEKNVRYFKQLQNIWNYSVNYREYKSINDTKAWRQITSQIYKPKLSLGVISSTNILRYAAIIIFAFVLGSTGMYFFNVKNEVKNGLFDSYNIVSVPLGSKTQIELPDGTKVWLNAGTELKYPTFFTGSTRSVFLKGEAFFDVEKQKDSKFIVNTDKIKIEVLGTRFNVKSYTEEGLIETTLVEGRVNLCKEGSSQIVKLEPNQRGVFVKREGLITNSDPSVEFLKKGERDEQFLIFKSIETDISTSWINNRLEFKGETFESLALKMERWHNVHIEIKDNTLKKHRFTGVFDKESVEQMIAALQIMILFNYKLYQNKIIIYND